MTTVGTNVTLLDGDDSGDTLNTNLVIQFYVMIGFTISGAIAGTFANCFTIAAIIRGKLYTHSGFLKITNLLVCNLIHCAIFLPLMAVQAFTGFWTHNSALCNAVSFGIFSNLGTELFGYVCISLNRYFCIVNHKLHDILYSRTSYLVAQFGLAWSTYPVIMALPLFGIWSHYEYAPKKLICHPFLGMNCTGYCLFVFVFALVTTVPVIFFCYLRIIVTYIKVKRALLQRQSSSKPGSRTHKISSTDTPSPKTIQSGSQKSKSSHNNSQKERHQHHRHKSEVKMAFTILAVIMFFAMFRVPFIILYIYDPSMTKVPALVHVSLIYAGTILNWVNPIIYAMTNKQIRRAMDQMVKSI